jgi:pimeloyl-ACP methyl ester carboxylesterase
LVSFLSEIIHLTPEQIEELKAAPAAYDIFSIVTATLPREAQALTTADLLSAARSVTSPVLLLLGATSPWAGDITRALQAALPAAELLILPGQGHEAVDAAPDLVVGELDRFFS